MKITALALFIFAGTAFATESYSQVMKVTVVADKISTGKVINEIEKQTDYLFVYNVNEVNLKRTVQVNAENKPVAEVLKEVFEGTNIYYAMEGKNIMLMSRTQGQKVVQQTNNKITGVVKDIKGETIIGASILEKGTTNGTISDINGNFTLSVSPNATLIVSYIGYKGQEVEAGRSPLTIILKEDTEVLDEVVVVGYGTVKKSDLTGSVGSIDAATITSSSATNAINAMQGKIAGVNITKNAARPGGTFNIRVRGLSSINNNTGPLWVIDGIPTNENMSDLNPNDIEKIDVLKDASATAIYGSRGANGVIIVSTKRGKKGQFNIQYDGYAGFRVASNLPDMMNHDEYFQWRTDLYTNLGRSTDRSNADFFTPEEWKLMDSGNYTDWINQTLRKGLQVSNTITGSGGDENGTFSIGLGQLKEEGTIPGQDYNRYNMHLSINRKVLKNWEIGGKLYFTYSTQNVGSYDVLCSAFRLPYIAYPYDEEGKPRYYVYRHDSVTNPLLGASDDGEIRDKLRYRAMGNLFLQVEPIKGLMLRSQLSPQMLHTRDGFYSGIYARNIGKKENTVATYNTSTYWGYVLDNQVTYTKDWGAHNFTANVVQTIQYERWESSNQGAKSFPFNTQWYNLDATPLSNVTASGTDYKQRSLASFLGRLQYSWKGKYLFTVSGRYDGSSRLAKGNKWAFFPSAAFAWRVSEEDFMKRFNNLSNLKLRLTYGVTGNDAVAIYGTQDGIAQMYYDFGDNISTAYYKNGLVNKDLTWEKTYEVNLGIDFGFFKNRINGAVDLYQRDAKDLITRRNLPSTSGWAQVWDNVGWVRNRGIEISINTTNIETRDFSWQTNLVFDTNKNEIMELYGEKRDDVGNKWFIGKSVQVNYDYVFDGIWQTSEATEAAKYGQTPGQVKVKDLDNNGVINADDKKVIGQQAPKWTGSITNTFQYKDWDLSFSIYTQQGAQLKSSFLSTFMSLEGNYKNLDVDYWTVNNPSNKYPQPGNRGKYFEALLYRDMSFVRVGDITLGYNIPKTLLSKINVKDLRIYFTTNNPFTFTSYPGFDPEWGSQNTWGDVTGYTTYLLGVKLKF